MCSELCSVIYPVSSMASGVKQDCLQDVHHWEGVAMSLFVLSLCHRLDRSCSLTRTSRPVVASQERRGLVQSRRLLTSQEGALLAAWPCLMGMAVPALHGFASCFSGTGETSAECDQMGSFLLLPAMRQDPHHRS